MNMATSELQSRSVRPESAAVRLERVPSVPADATVRHVDQFETETLDAIYRAVTEDRPVSAAETDLEPGEVIVFTDYFRVERV
ncbi:hypothetical protein NP511_13130 [Natrinema thermotolerans]|uniref:Uncharacterized protein n=1 Tax=Natrinema thermotolerans TaxID=121872 RepID=A0AAF0PCR3_9EURY|nr:hypothetical protein [Natrinema thermotolerans]ELZ18865.1 hypothetical protein C478_00245 [Natrinema thermotolerans DSM 11552]QCC59358.1 hypothetical protein DVR14_12265 [Natrinema thermotolerans]WMT06328.1 hypothetical protein NP511_13130 [Natrinema thermotolerans]